MSLWHQMGYHDNWINDIITKVLIQLLCITQMQSIPEQDDNLKL